MTTINKLVSAMAFTLAVSSQAQASTVEYILNQSNVLADGTPYLDVKISDVGDDIAFTVQTLPALTSIADGSNYGIVRFGFNGGSLGSGDVVFTGDAAGYWHFTNTSKNLAEFGSFLNIDTANQGNKTVDPLTFTIVKSGDSISDYTTANALGYLFAAHVIDINTGTTDDSGEPQTSAWFAGNSDGLVPPEAVPVPAAAWLFSSGLAGLLGMARRKRKVA